MNPIMAVNINALIKWTSPFGRPKRRLYIVTLFIAFVLVLLPPTGTWNHVPESDKRSVFEPVDRDSLIKIQFGMSPDAAHHIMEKKPSLDGAPIPIIRENGPIRTSNFDTGVRRKSDEITDPSCENHFDDAALCGRGIDHLRPTI
jgi:hypothetical protein